MDAGQHSLARNQWVLEHKSSDSVNLVVIQGPDAIRKYALFSARKGDECEQVLLLLGGHWRQLLLGPSRILVWRHSIAIQYAKEKCCELPNDRRHIRRAGDRHQPATKRRLDRGDVCSCAGFKCDGLSIGGIRHERRTLHQLTRAPSSRQRCFGSSDHGEEYQHCPTISGSTRLWRTNHQPCCPKVRNTTINL